MGIKLTPELAKNLGIPMPKRGHKYGAQRCEYNGRSYHSRAEMLRAQELDLYVRCGEAVRWKAQPRFQLTPSLAYTADFLVEWPDGTQTVEDVKGFETHDFRRIKQLWADFGPLPLVILKKRRKRDGGGWSRTRIERTESNT